MKKQEGNPELETFTILNPNFVLPSEVYSSESKLEKQLSEGNISKNDEVKD
ncbi:hypothetical protein [Ornithinibacillus scapharcae]|uniref:hypothetical protein n=1 Tax=Ornithinibacillus scapharcae TaxID=1147159 RepID=UPI000225B563|nr:hypothetical protein [Ornithinibacillus scapharcae]